MKKSLYDLDKRAYIFLVTFLNIILADAAFLIIYGVYYAYISEYTPLLVYQNIKISLEYLLTSLLLCITGTVILDYIFRKRD